MPDELVRAAEQAQDDRAIKAIGIEWCIQQAKELKEAGVPALHFYTMGRAEPTSTIAKAVF